MNATKLSPLFASTFVAVSVAISGIAGAQSSARIDVTPYRAAPRMMAVMAYVVAEMPETLPRGTPRSR